MPDIASWFRIDPWVIVVFVILLVAFLAFVFNRGIRVHRQQVSAGKEDLVGKSAEVAVALNPEGTVMFRGERWKAVSEEGRVELGEEVIINKVDNLKLYVVKKQ